MRTRPWWRAAAVMVAAVAAVAGACAGGDDESADPGREGAGQLAESGSGNDADPVPTEPGSGDPDPVVAAPVPSEGCATTPAGAEATQRHDLPMNGTDRWYLLTAPNQAPGADPVPLVLDIHGLSEGAEFHAGSTGWNELAASEGFVVAFPHGSGRTVGWDIRSSGPNPDLDFIDAVVGDVGRRHCIDTSRTYATGLSNGAFMSSVLACTRPETFAAVAPVAGVVHPPDCAPGRPVPLLGFHGTADPLLPFNGSVSAGAVQGIKSGTGVTTTTPPAPDLDGPGYPANTAEWAAANGCGEHTDERTTESVVRRSWDCPEDGEVEFLMVEGGGHTWPGSDALTDEGIAAIVGPTNMEIDATALAWEFFGRHRLEG